MPQSDTLPYNQLMKNKIPPPIIMSLFGLLIYLEDKYFFASILIEFDKQRITTICISIVAACIIALGMLEFSKAKTTVDPLRPERASSLVNTGIFKFTRNPMYLGMAIFLIAWCIKLGDILGLAIIPFFIWYMTVFQIKPEEKAMQKIFGEEYLNYKTRVRRWF